MELTVKIENTSYDKDSCMLVVCKEKEITKEEEIYKNLGLTYYTKLSENFMAKVADIDITSGKNTLVLKVDQKFLKVKVPQRTEMRYSIGLDVMFSTKHTNKRGFLSVNTRANEYETGDTLTYGCEDILILFAYSEPLQNTTLGIAKYVIYTDNIDIVFQGKLTKFDKVEVRKTEDIKEAISKASMFDFRLKRELKLELKRATIKDTMLHI